MEESRTSGIVESAFAPKTGTYHLQDPLLRLLAGVVPANNHGCVEIPLVDKHLPHTVGQPVGFAATLRAIIAAISRTNAFLGMTSCTLLLQYDIPWYTSTFHSRHPSQAYNRSANKTKGKESSVTDTRPAAWLPLSAPNVLKAVAEHCYLVLKPVPELRQRLHPLSA